MRTLPANSPPNPMRNAILVTALLTAGISFSTQAQTTDPLAPGLEQPVLTPDPPRAATVLALAPPAPLPDLAAPLPVQQVAPQATSTARPTDGIGTTRLILGIASAVLALVVAIVAIKK